MKGSLEKYLFFNTTESKEGRPRDEKDEINDAAREAQAELAFTATEVYHKLYKGLTATSGDIAAGQQIIKVRSISKVKGGGANVGDVVTVIDEKRNGILEEFIPASGGVVDSIGNFVAYNDAGTGGYYPVTLVANVAGDLDYSADITDAIGPGSEIERDKYSDNIWYKFSGNDGSNGGGGDKDPTTRAQLGCYPVERFKGYLIEDDGKSYEGGTGATRAAGRGVLIMVFEPLIGSGTDTVDGTTDANWDYVYLRVTSGKQKEVMKSISQHINGSRNTDDGFITIFDDIAKETVSPHILAAAIQLAVNK